MLTEAVVEGYWEHHRLQHMVDPPQQKEADLLFWSWEVVHAVVEAPDEYAISLLIALAEAAPADPSCLDFLGADAIEDYLARENRPPDIDAVVAAAENHQSFRVALGAAWYRNKLSADDTARLQAFGVSPREGPGPARREDH